MSFARSRGWRAAVATTLAVGLAVGPLPAAGGEADAGCRCPPSHCVCPHGHDASDGHHGRKHHASDDVMYGHRAGSDHHRGQGPGSHAADRAEASAISPHAAPSAPPSSTGASETDRQAIHTTSDPQPAAADAEAVHTSAAGPGGPAGPAGFGDGCSVVSRCGHPSDTSTPACHPGVVGGRLAVPVPARGDGLVFQSRSSADRLRTPPEPPPPRSPR